MCVSHVGCTVLGEGVPGFGYCRCSLRESGWPKLSPISPNVGALILEEALGGVSY